MMVSIDPNDDASTTRSISSSYTPLVVIFFSGLVTVTKFRRSLSRDSSVKGWIIDATIGLFVYCSLPEPSILPWWGPLTSLVCQTWPKILGLTFPTRNGNNNAGNDTVDGFRNSSSFRGIIQSLVHGGPLGRGCKKVMEVLVAIFVWRFVVHGTWPFSVTSLFLPLPGTTEWMAILAFSAIVALVLRSWSTAMGTRGNHGGVDDAVEGTWGRALSVGEHLGMLGLAFVNGACEELTSRWFWRNEFAAYLPDADDAGPGDRFLPSSVSHSNLAQAALFGIWHYHGIPSGLTGVALTFVYGYIMGMLQDYQNGLFLSILTHTIADYYIFAIIARQQQKGISKTTKAL